MTFALHPGPSATTVPANGPGDYSAAEVWKAVAVRLCAELIDSGASAHDDCIVDCIVAYNHARNGRYAEAMAVLAE